MHKTKLTTIHLLFLFFRCFDAKLFGFCVFALFNLSAQFPSIAYLINGLDVNITNLETSILFL